MRVRLLKTKGILSGAKTLGEARQRAEAFAQYLARLEMRGWTLDGPVTDDYAYIRKKRENPIDANQDAVRDGPDALGRLSQ